MLKNKLCVFALLAGWVAPNSASSLPGGFRVSGIQVKGLQRLSQGAALLQIPIRVGDEVSRDDISDSLKKLYRSGDFQNVSVYRDHNALIYRVRERPIIISIDFYGNHDIKKDSLKESLSAQGVKIGKPVAYTKLSNIEQELQDLYYSVGKCRARVKATMTQLSRNRVSLRLYFQEGLSAKIQQINFIGNEHFSDNQLAAQMQLTDHIPWWDLMGSRKYQKQRLAGDLETLKNFYCDRGYVNFRIDSTQVQLTPDRRYIYITINLHEGSAYTIKKVVLGGNLLEKKQQIWKLIKIKPGSVYNGSSISEMKDTLEKYLGQFGYAYPRVRIYPQVDEEIKTVTLNVNLNPGNRIYVRRINITGNSITEDRVIRREIQQLEGTWLSSLLLEQSKKRLARLGYFSKVDIKTNRVQGSLDEIDIDFNVEEHPTGSIIAGIGYGTTSRISLSTQISQKNFLGTGDEFGISAINNYFSKKFKVNHTDPYFTRSGVSLGEEIYYKDFDASKANLVNYTNQAIGAKAMLGFPINGSDRLSVGLGGTMNKISQSNPYEQIRQFWNIYNGYSNETNSTLNFKTLSVMAGWTSNNLNKGHFPTSGSLQHLNFKMTVPGSDTQYFKAYFDRKDYFALDKYQEWSLLLHGRLGYGNGYGKVDDSDQILPFFENFYAGGWGSIRGFSDNTVGPHTIYQNYYGGQYAYIPGGAVGGNAVALGNLELIFPTPFISMSYARQIRTTAFVDFGTVWDTEYDTSLAQGKCLRNCSRISNFSHPNRIRASVGVSLQWWSPVGTIDFSFSKPVKKYPGDRTEFFSFNLGQIF